jgi:hypothetical protein
MMEKVCRFVPAEMNDADFLTDWQRGQLPHYRILFLISRRFQFRAALRLGCECFGKARAGLRTMPIRLYQAAEWLTHAWDFQIR